MAEEVLGSFAELDLGNISVSGKQQPGRERSLPFYISFRFFKPISNAYVRISA